MAAKAPQDQQVPLSSLTLQQLMSLKGQLEQELSKLSTTISLTSESVNKAQQAKEALTSFSTSESGREMLVPVTESMYVKGVVQETKRPIIEIGTGYFVETSVDNANAFFSRRLSRLNQQQETLRLTFKEKQQQYQIVVQIANQKIQQQQQMRAMAQQPQ